MARGLAVLTDNHVQQAVVDGLLRAGWDVLRAIADPPLVRDPHLTTAAFRA